MSWSIPGSPLSQQAGADYGEAASCWQVVDVLFAALPLGLVLFDQEGRCVRVNGLLAQMDGTSTEKHLGRRPEELFADMGKVVASCVRQVMKTGEPLVDVDLDGETVMGPGMRREWLASCHPIPGEAGRPDGVLMVVRNVTESRHAQRLLQESEQNVRLSEERFRQVVESAPDGLVMVEASGRIVLVNAGIERMFGYLRSEVVGQSIEMLIPGRYQDAHQAHREAYQSGPVAREMGAKRELYARRKDGSEFPVEVALNPIPTQGGAMVLATVVDITRRKADQAMLEEALMEKTALLNEVHHRVKNNLQVISSLLNLQSRNASPEARAVLSESQSRVKAMALIHQLLYERNDFSRLDLGLYLQRLCSLLRDSFSTAPGRVKLFVEAPAGEVAMDLQRAVPCGLLVNELVTNAMKHAFPGERRGSVIVRLRRSEDGRGLIMVADDGIGLPPDVEVGRSLSLGFQLIPLLVEQLGGELTLSRDLGTIYEIRFAASAWSKP